MVRNSEVSRQMIHSYRTAVLLFACWTAFGLAPAVARDRSGQSSGFVRACSPYGNGCVSGPVRPAKFGPQVRLKSGTWIDCKSDCGQALLEETIDFWDSQSEKAMILTR